MGRAIVWQKNICSKCYETTRESKVKLQLNSMKISHGQVSHAHCDSIKAMPRVVYAARRIVCPACGQSIIRTHIFHSVRESSIYQVAQCDVISNWKTRFLNKRFVLKTECRR